MSAAVAEISEELAAVDLGTPESWRLHAARELAHLDVAEHTDSTDVLLIMMRQYPAEAAQYVDVYTAGYKYALAHAAGGVQ